MKTVLMLTVLGLVACGPVLEKRWHPHHGGHHPHHGGHHPHHGGRPGPWKIEKRFHHGGDPHHGGHHGGDPHHGGHHGPDPWDGGHHGGDHWDGGHHGGHHGPDPWDGGHHGGDHWDGGHHGGHDDHWDGGHHGGHDDHHGGHDHGPHPHPPPHPPPATPAATTWECGSDPASTEPEPTDPAPETTAVGPVTTTRNYGICETTGMTEQAKTACSVLNQPPFTVCEGVDVGDEKGGYFRDCMADYCKCFGDDSCICPVVKQVVEACGDNEAVKNWQSFVPACSKMKAPAS